MVTNFKKKVKEKLSIDLRIEFMIQLILTLYRIYDTINKVRAISVRFMLNFRVSFSFSSSFSERHNLKKSPPLEADSQVKNHQLALQMAGFIPMDAKCPTHDLY